MRPLNKTEKIHILIWIILLLIIGIVIYLLCYWSSYFYFKTDHDGKCIVSGYDYELKINHYFNIDKYQCLPLLVVDYEVKGESFSNVKTYTFEKDKIEQGMIFDNFTEVEKYMCLNYYSNNGNYAIDKDIGNCYVCKSHYHPNFICRLKNSGDISNNCCDDGLVNWTGLFVVSLLFGIGVIIVVMIMSIIARDLIIEHTLETERINRQPIPNQVLQNRLQPIPNQVQNSLQLVYNNQSVQQQFQQFRRSSVPQGSIHIKPKKKPEEVTLKKAHIGTICSVCDKNKCELLFSPCGHICVCRSCYDCMENKKCPVCMSEVEVVMIIMEEIRLEV